MKCEESLDFSDIAKCATVLFYLFHSALQQLNSKLQITVRVLKKFIFLALEDIRIKVK